MYIKSENGHHIIIFVYVDDIIFGNNKDELCKYFANKMQKEFEMLIIGEFSYFLDLQFYKKEIGIFISQIKYIKEMLTNFTMEDCKPLSIPMTTSYKLSTDEKSPPIDQTMYMSMIGSLLYLSNTRPNIM